jgi:Na+-driven multidrug efflux pump
VSQDPQARLILEGRPLQVLVRMAVPAVAVMLMFGLNSVMDAVYIGQLIGERALAGVSLAFPITQVTLGLGSLGGIGGGVMLSIAIGRGDSDLLRRLPGHLRRHRRRCWPPSMVWSVPCVRRAPGPRHGRDRRAGTDRRQLPSRPCPGWASLRSPGLTLNMLLRGEGKMALAAWFMAIGLVANLVLTPIFIAVFGVGESPAQPGRPISAPARRRCWSGSASPEGRPAIRSMRATSASAGSLCGRIARLGVPAMISSSMGLVQAAVVFNVLSRIGSEQDIAFFGAAWRVLLFLLTPLFGLMRAFQPVAGINYGAERWDRVRLHYWLFVVAGLVMVLPIWTVLNLFPEQVLSVMLPDVLFSDQDLHHFRVLMVVLPALPIVFTALSLLPAVERPGLATTVSVARQLALYVPVMILLPQWIGISGVYYGATAIDLLCSVWLLLIVLWLFRNQGGRGGKIGPSIGPTDPWSAGTPGRG